MTKIIVTTPSGSRVSADILPGSSFVLEISQPVLNTEKIPVPFSTDISFPPTKTNKEIFGYVPIYKLPPQNTRLAAEIVVDGITIDTGIIQYTGIESGNLQYTYAGRDLEDGWSRKIWDPTDSFLSEVYSHRRENDYYEYGALGYMDYPIIVDKSDENNPRTSIGQTLTEKYPRYLNWNPFGNNNQERVLPAFYVSKLITMASDGIPFTAAGSPLASLLSNLVLMAPYNVAEKYKHSTWFNSAATLRTGFFAGLPDITVAELVKNVLNMACASIFRKDSGYVLKSASDLLSSDAEDLSGKISDIFSASVETAKRYLLSYSGAKDADQSDVPASKYTTRSGIKNVLEYATRSGITNGDITWIKNSATGDILSISGYRNTAHSGSNATRSVMESQDTGRLDDTDSDMEDMTVSVGLTPVPCTPDYIPTSVEYDSDAGTRYQPSSPASVAYMEIPSADSERGKDAFVGHMSSDKQISDKGIVTNPSTGVDATIGPSLKTDSLFSTYHSDLASWMAKDRQVVTAALNLKAAEIVNIKMYNRVYFASRYWIISKLTIELSAAGGVRTTGEFIEA